MFWGGPLTAEQIHPAEEMCFEASLPASLEVTEKFGLTYILNVWNSIVKPSYPELFFVGLYLFPVRIQRAFPTEIEQTIRNLFETTKECKLVQPLFY